LNIRHRLTPWLLERGGHIGYDVRPSARNNGYATSMLGDSLPIARRLSIADVLVTCDVDNSASRRVIEKNGGQLEDERCGMLRFWVGNSLGLVPPSQLQSPSARPVGRGRFLIGGTGPAGRSEIREVAD